jgi:hypothetical protein
MRQDQQFWAIVQNLQWRLHEGASVYPTGEPEFFHVVTRGRRRPNIRVWSTHLFAFGLGVFALGLALLITSL